MEPSAHGLRAFLVVARHRHFGRAAEELHVTGPALSQLIRRLERDLGTSLFDRSTRAVALTAAGADLLPYAHRVIEALDGIEKWRAHRAGRNERRIVFGFTVNGGGELMNRLLSDVRRSLPELEVTPRQVAWTDVASSVLDGTHDVVIARGPRYLARVDFQPIRSEPWVVVVPAGHALASAGRATLADLARYPLLMPQLSPGERRPRWLAGPDSRGRAPIAGPATGTLEEALDHVLVGSGVFVTGASAAMLYPRPGIAYVPLTGLKPGFIGLITDPVHRTPTIEAFVRIAAESARAS